MDMDLVTIVNESNSSKRKKLDPFPIILHRILSDPRFNHIITWAPHGHAWKIVNRDLFLHEVVPKFFYLKLFKSFLRQVTGWGFIRINNGENEGFYYHQVRISMPSNQRITLKLLYQLFLRGKPELIMRFSKPLDFKAARTNEDDCPTFTLERQVEASVGSESVGSPSNHAVTSIPSIPSISASPIYPSTITNSVQARISCPNLNVRSYFCMLLEHRQMQILIHLENLNKLECGRFLLKR